MKNTPKPPLKITEIFPFLSGMEKTTIRLHPRPGKQIKLHQSKIGGHFLWPENEPWPICQQHNDVYSGIIQLRAEDFPEIKFPANANLFQLLWCPHDDFFDFPKCLVFWRNDRQIINYLQENPQPSHPNQDLVPNPCCIFPERITEYPNIREFEGLAEEERIGQWDEENNYIYQHLLSTAPGFKIEGYPSWIQDCETPICKCGRQMEHLLTVASCEFDLNNYLRWCPIEDEPVWRALENLMKFIREEPLLYREREVEIDNKKRQICEIAAQDRMAAGLKIGYFGSVYVFICRQCKEWPIESVFQCS
ncbi:MAG: DUF1963 domain-containing protein [Xenococcaceae cyanobacterium]